MKQQLLATARNTAYYQWPFNLIVPRLRPRAGILVYHRVADTTTDPYNLAVSPELFKEQIRFLRKNYRIMALNEFVENFASVHYSDRTIVITFDDGYLDNYTHAYPITASYNVPITVFVTSQPIIEEKKLFWWDELAALTLYSKSSEPLIIRSGTCYNFTFNSDNDRKDCHKQLYQILFNLNTQERNQILETIRAWAKPDSLPDMGRPMTIKELQEFAALPGVTIGAHTMTHTQLSRLSLEEQHDELAGSKSALEEITSRTVTTLAYPFGKDSTILPQTSKLASGLGYSAAFTTNAVPVVPSHSSYTLPRLSVHNWSATIFEKRLQAFFGQKEVS